MNMTKNSLNLSLDEDNSSFVSEDWRTDWATISFSSDQLNNTEKVHNESNSTLESFDWKEPYTSALNILLLIMLVTIMFTMGCEVKWKNVKYRFPFCLFILSVIQMYKYATRGPEKCFYSQHFPNLYENSPKILLYVISYRLT